MPLDVGVTLNVWVIEADRNWDTETVCVRLEVSVPETLCVPEALWVPVPLAAPLGDCVSVGV